tara:strand:+ start:118 stop:477 length:360 start_codon:yes stop_codon:yes gene_type:complete
MEKNITKRIFEFFSLSLILSYQFFHEIFPVLIGIMCSIYILNIDSIINFTRFIKSKFSKKSIVVNSTNSVNPSNFNNIKFSESTQIEIKNKYSNLSLVEIIEEVGYIPSIDKKEDINTA